MPWDLPERVYVPTYTTFDGVALSAVGSTKPSPSVSISSFRLAVARVRTESVKSIKLYTDLSISLVCKRPRHEASGQSSVDYRWRWRHGWRAGAPVRPRGRGCVRGRPLSRQSNPCRKRDPGVRWTGDGGWVRCAAFRRVGEGRRCN